jgi:hypothetical protein
MLDLLVENLRDVLQDVDVPRDSRWAFYRCQETVEIYDAVYGEQPPAVVVKDLVLPVLVDAQNAVSHASRTGPYADKVLGFVNNINERIRDLSQYVTDHCDCALVESPADSTLLALPADAKSRK